MPVELSAFDHILQQSVPIEPRPAQTAATINSSDILFRAQRYADIWPGIGQGQRNNEAFHHAAQLRKDFALSEADALPILQEWNQRNTPPLDDAELRDVLRSGDMHGKHAIGAKLLERPRARTIKITPSNTEGGNGDGKSDKVDLLTYLKYPRTDSSIAEAFAAMFGDKYRYDHNQKAWGVWTGTRWDFAKGGYQTSIDLVKLARKLRALALQDEGNRGQIEKDALALEQHNKKVNVLAEAKNLEPFACYSDQFDTDPMRLNIESGTVDLETGDQYSHNPNDYITKISPCIYDPNCPSELVPYWPEWMDFLSTITNNQDLMEFLQRAVGYAATGLTSEDKLFMPIGPTATGKSTFCESVKSALGSYAKTTDFQTFLRRTHAGEIRNDIASLAGARFVLSIEVDEGKRLAEGLVKTLSGQDTISARFLYRESFEFVPTFKLWLTANHAPRVNAADDAMWRRILRIPFDNQIPEDERNPEVKAIFRDPTRGGRAVLRWIIDGCRMWQKDGLGVPSIVKDTTREYQAEMDDLNCFIEERCSVGSAVSCGVGELRQAYSRWASETGTFELSRKAFKEQLESKGYRQTEESVWYGGKTERRWKGIGLVVSETSQTSQEKASFV